MQFATLESLLDTLDLGRAAEQLAVCLAKQASQQLRSKYNSHAKPARSVKMCYNKMM